MSLREERTARFTGVAALVLVVVAIVWLLFFKGGGTYTIHAHFQDAGQLVTGDLVEVGAGPVGTVDAIRLTDDGQADVVLKITDRRFTPLHRGTVAQIRAVGLASVANRFVELTPGPPSGARIDSGGALGTTETRGIVDLDVLLDELDPKTRANLQTILRNGADAFSRPQAANKGFEYLNPALSRTAALGQEVVRDQAALQRLISSSAQVVGTLAHRQADLTQGITNTAATLRTVAGQDAALRDSLALAPGVLTEATSTLRSLRTTLRFVTPTLTAARPVAPRLARLLRQAVPVTNAVLPAIESLRGQLPALRQALAGLPQVAAGAVPAVESATKSIGYAQPIFATLRPYSADLAAGLFNGFGGSTSGPYDANGHYTRISALLGQGSGQGLLSLVPGLNTPGAGGLRTGLQARCPGGAATPAADKSNPYIPDSSICNPADDATK